MPKININNAEFYYELHGQGEPVVLISGYGANHLFWFPILPLLSQHFQVLVFDNRAIGQTIDNSHFPLTAEFMANDTMALIKELGLKKPHIVGQSMGGTIAQNIAARFPTLINKLGILNSSAKWRQAMLRGLWSMWLIRKANNFDCWFETNLAWVFGEEFLQNSEQVENLRLTILNDPYPQSVENQERQYAALTEFDGRAALKNITAKTLVSYGTQDIISLPSESKEIAENIMQAKLIEFDCGHGIVAEVPHELARTLIDFLM